MTTITETTSKKVFTPIAVDKIRLLHINNTEDRGRELILALVVDDEVLPLPLKQRHTNDGMVSNELLISQIVAKQNRKMVTFEFSEIPEFTDSRMTEKIDPVSHGYPEEISDSLSETRIDESHSNIGYGYSVKISLLWSDLILRTFAAHTGAAAFAIVSKSRWNKDFLSGEVSSIEDLDTVVHFPLEETPFLESLTQLRNVIQRTNKIIYDIGQINTMSARVIDWIERISEGDSEALDEVFSYRKYFTESYFNSLKGESYKEDYKDAYLIKRVVESLYPATSPNEFDWLLDDCINKYNQDELEEMDRTAEMFEAESEKDIETSTLDTFQEYYDEYGYSINPENHSQLERYAFYNAFITPDTFPRAMRRIAERATLEVMNEYDWANGVENLKYNKQNNGALIIAHIISLSVRMARIKEMYPGYDTAGLLAQLLSNQDSWDSDAFWFMRTVITETVMGTLSNDLLAGYLENNISIMSHAMVPMNMESDEEEDEEEEDLGDDEEEYCEDEDCHVCNNEMMEVHSATYVREDQMQIFPFSSYVFHNFAHSIGDKDWSLDLLATLVEDKKYALRFVETIEKYQTEFNNDAKNINEESDERRAFQQKRCYSVESVLGFYDYITEQRRNNELDKFELADDMSFLMDTVAGLHAKANFQDLELEAGKRKFLEEITSKPLGH